MWKGVTTPQLVKRGLLPRLIHLLNLRHDCPPPTSRRESANQIFLITEKDTGGSYGRGVAAAAASLQSCPTLCNPIDGSPPGSPVPGTLQARTLEWVAISFSNA